ncbi:peptidoglycan-binding protein LysM [Bizionia argentinensis JUB59]|uniref:Peptidoglycan-binding protein LysM n=1 Tax=Bizionia argentinensis JUB59 TaxID=1046627 RepID=G2EAH2_9FLAO|nr:peptidoglycan-binding protein LysM [Bizionia argentinensis JUB59]
MSLATFAFTLLIFGISNSWAQQAKTTINLVLADVISIDPGSASNDGSVDFHYDNVNDYNSEKTTTIPNSLVITFTKPFDLKVKANGENFEFGSNLIPVNVLIIKRNESSQITGTSVPIVLSTQDQVLIRGADRGSRLTLDLDYTIPQAKSSSSDILGKPAGTYTQKVTYTATAL